MAQAPQQAPARVKKKLSQAILDGDISLDDALTHYRPPTGGERAQTFSGILARAAGDAYRSGTTTELLLAERGLRVIGADSVADWMRGFADYVAPGGGLGKDVAEASRRPGGLPLAMAENTATTANKALGLVGIDANFSVPDLASDVAKAAMPRGSPEHYLADPFVPPAAQNDSPVWKAFTQYLPEGLGSSIGLLALPGPKGLSGVALRGAFVGAGQQFVEAKAHGADDATAWGAFAGGALLGATEAGLPGKWATPLGKILARADKASGGGATAWLKEWIKGGAKEFGQEALQTLGENYLASDLAKYDEDRALIQGVLEAGEGGALTGLLIGAMAGWMRPGRSTGQQETPGAEVTAPVSTVTAPVSSRSAVDPSKLSPAALQAAQDLGVDPATLEEAPEGIREFVGKRGGEVYVARGSKKAGAIRENAMVVSDSPDGLDTIVDHEVAHLTFQGDPEAAETLRRAVDTLAPEVRSQVREDYLQDALTTKRQELDRELTPEEEQAVRAESAPAEDEELAVLAQDFSGLVRLLRKNPEAFAKLKDPSAWRSLVRGVTEFGSNVTFQKAPEDLTETYKALAGRGYAAGVEPKVGVGIAKALGSYLDSLVGKKASPAAAQVKEEAATFSEPVAAPAEVEAESAPQPIPETVKGPSFALYRRAFPTAGGAQMEFGKFDQIRRVAQDAWLPVSRWRDAIATAGKVTEANDIVLMEDLRRSGTMNRIKTESTAYVAPLKELVISGPVTNDEAGTYLLARAAADRDAMIEARNGAKNGSGIPPAEAAKIIAAAETGPNAEHFAKIAAAFDRLTNRTLEVKEQSGLTTPEETARLREQEPKYAPQRTDERSEMLYGQGGRSQMGTARTRRKEFRSALGRSTQADNPLVFATMDLMSAIERGTWNDTVGRSLIDLARVVADPKVVTIDTMPMKKALVDGKVKDVPDLTDRANEIVVKENGVPRVVRFGKGWETVAQAIKGSDAVTADSFIRSIGRSLQWATRQVANASVRWNPFFWPVNTARDILAAGMHATGDFGPVEAFKAANPKAVARAAKDIATKGPWLQRFERAGGPTAWYDLARTFEEQSNRIVREINDAQHPNAPWAMTRRYASKLADLLDYMGSIAENSTRLSVFKYLIETQGWSDARAAQYAKSITTNFEKRGTHAWLMSLHAFSNASIQGGAKAIKVMRTPWGQRLVAGSIAGSFLISALNRITGGDDEDGVPKWDKIPDWERRSNAIFLVGDQKLKVPLPFVWNVFNALGTEMERAMFGEQTAMETALAMGSTVAGALNPLGGEGDILDTLTPTLADPLSQLERNRDYAGRAILPEKRDKGAPDSSLAWESTSPSAIAVAKKLNELSGGDAGTPGLIDVSPASIEFFLKNVFGGAGAEASRSIRIAEKMVNGEDLEQSDVPGWRRFAGSMGLLEQREFYKRVRETVKAQERLEKSGEPFDRDLWRLRKRVNGWDDRIADLNRELRKDGADRNAIRAELRELYLTAIGEIRGEARAQELEARR